MVTAQIDYVMRVKLPSSASYHSSPSGDTDYDNAYRDAIFKDKPEGFEVAWKSAPTWPIDKDGLTWVKLYLTDQSKALEHWMDKAFEAEKRIREMQAIAQKLVGASP